MTWLGDANACRESGRLLRQHQVALTLVQGFLSDPQRETIRWLDLACGRGQILGLLESNFLPDVRARIDYVGYDINESFARETRRLANSLGLHSVDVSTGLIARFPWAYAAAPPTLFDFVLFTNAMHEMPVADLPMVLVDCLLGLADGGSLFFYDVDSVWPPELGAIAWSGDEIRALFKSMLEALGDPAYDPIVGCWPHRSCEAWNLYVQRAHIGVSRQDGVARRQGAIQALQLRLRSLLADKRESCRSALEALTQNGASRTEIPVKVRFLHEYWALSRSLELAQ